MNNRIFKVNDNTSSTIYCQLAEFIADAIHAEEIKVGGRLLSVNDACREYNVSRDTVLSAYKLLQERTIIKSIPGKGFFVIRKNNAENLRIYALFDAMNQYKETLYRSLLENLGSKYEISIAFHYYNEELFDTLVSNAKGKFDYYILMPHFKEDVTNTIDKLPIDRILLLDAFPQNYTNTCAAVYQNFYSDSYEGLKSILDKLRRYKALHIVYNDKFQYMPSGYIEGAYRFAGEFQFPVYVEPGFNMDNILPGHCYMAVSERDLAAIIKSITAKGLKVKEEIGLMSLDDTPLKEVLIGGITTLTTDFELMGRTAAELIKSGERRRIANPWRLLDRGSL